MTYKLEDITVTLSLKDLNEIQEYFKLNEDSWKEKETYISYLESALDCFFTGNIPEGANLKQIILAQWGRKRLESIVKKPKLLDKL